MKTDMDSGFKMVIVTAPVRDAEKIGRIAVEKKLAACVNIIGKIKSIYWWKNKLNTDNESMLIFKTIKGKIGDLLSAIKKEHTYEVPEIIVLNIEEGNPDYFKWITESVG